MPLSNPVPVLAGTGITKTGYTLAIDQSFTPTWTGLHQFDAGIGATANLTLQPVGDLIIDPAGNDVLPTANYDINLGSLAKKFLTLHAAELWVETLVAQNTIATIGGRILVGPTTTFTRDVAAIDTTIYVKHNEMASGDRVYSEANGKVEWMAVTSSATLQGAGDYAYTVTRDLDGTGANVWNAGDALFNTGTTGDGFIDLYSVSGVKAGSGPTIAGNVRNSATYNDITEHWAIGNLNGLYGYAVTTYGIGLGEYAASKAHLTVDSTNGIRFFTGLTAVVAQWAANGTITLGDAAAEHVAISSSAVQIKDGATVYTDLTAGALSLGDTANEHVLVNTTGVLLKDGASVYGQFAATTTIGLTTSEHVSITSTSVQIKDGSTVYTDLTAGALLLGQTGAGQNNAYLSAGGLQLRLNTTVKVDISSAGDLKIGSDTSAAATTGLAVFTTAQTYNGEAMGAGDLLISDNTATKSNIWFDYSSASLHFRSGTTSILRLDSAGLGLANAVWLHSITQSGSGLANLIRLNTSDQTEIGGSIVKLTNLVASGAVSVGSSPSDAGVLRMPNAQTMTARNAANDGNINMLTVQSDDLLHLRVSTVADSDLKIAGSVGFYNTAVQTKQTVTGAKGSNAALASLLTALATIGLITDSSSA